jgi:predicted CoA-binding protein
MTSRQAVNDFLSQKTIALIGVSRSGKKMGNSILRALHTNGYRVLPVHPAVPAIEGVPCYPALAALPEPVENLLVVVPPQQTAALLPEAHSAGVSRVWMQQGSSSPAALNFCSQHGITAVHGECILMYLPQGPAIHRVHRWLRELFGRMPR